MTLDAVPTEMVERLDGLDKVTTNPSFCSNSASDATWTVTVFVDSNAANETTPLGKTPPTKSAGVALLIPMPETVQATVPGALSSPNRVTL